MFKSESSWGHFLVFSLTATDPSGKPMSSAWIGLDYESIVLHISYFPPTNSLNDKIWDEFIE